MNIVKNLTNLSIVVQWNVVDGFLPMSYTINWNGGRDQAQAAAVANQTSFTITGLTLDTVYTINVTAINVCGSGPEFITNVTLSTGMCYFH